MKIVFIARPTLYTRIGGDTNQIIHTAKHLELLGVKVDIKLSNDPVNYQAYDLIHFFNIIRPADILKHINVSQLPYVVSTIYVDYSEYDNKYRGGLIGIVNRCLGSDAVEYIKIIARSVKNGEKIHSLAYLLKGHRKSIQHILRHAAYLLPNSHNEYQRLVKDYGIENKYAFIPNAIDKSSFYHEVLPEEKERRSILCVGRIDQYKNQLNLIRAVKSSSYELKIVGKAAPNHFKYYEQCVKEASEMDNVEFLGQLSPKELANLYMEARVHVLPSWFETTGLSNLEAGALGCQLVIADKGDTREYLGDHAFYCQPEDVTSIRRAIDQAYEAPTSPVLREKILQNYTWEKTAAATLKVYKEIIAE